MQATQTIRAFFALVKGGLWGENVRILSFGKIDYDDLYRLATEQAVVGLVAAGLELLIDVKIPQVVALNFAGAMLQLEQRNKAMNAFIAETVERMRLAGINSMLVKGQGIAQCYEKPLWRTSGDVDFVFCDDNYPKAKAFFLPQSCGHKSERQYSKEFGLNIDQWLVELHGTQRTGLSSRIDKILDTLQKSAFYDGKVRFWMNGNTQVFIPNADEDVLFVFTHLLKHFYKGEGVNVRQICDLSRLIYCHYEQLDLGLLELRLKRMRLMTEWKAFGAVAVKCLGMPKDAMPFYKESVWGDKKARKIVGMILRSENKGRFAAAFSAIRIFPLNTLLFLPGILFDVNWLKVRERFKKDTTV